MSAEVARAEAAAFDAEAKIEEHPDRAKPEDHLIGFETQLAEAIEARARLAKKRAQAEGRLKAVDQAEADADAAIAELEKHVETAKAALPEGD